MISETTIQAVRDLSIIDVAGRYTELKKAGSSWRGLSPLSEEKTPSFYADDKQNLWYCYSTAQGGDGIRFIMQKHGLSFYEAIIRLAEDHSIPVEREQEPEQAAETRELRDQAREVLQTATKRYQAQLIGIDPAHPANYDLIERRRYTIETLIGWEFGFATDDWQFLAGRLADTKYYHATKEVGVIAEKKGRSYDTLRGRWVLPIRNHRGEIVAMAGRTHESGTAKYINTKESVLYSKKKTLFGLYQSLKAISTMKSAYLVEGYTDVISLHQAGIENTVGTCGTALTPEQAALLKRYCPRVVVVYDGDAAGVKATARAVAILLAAGLDVYTVSIPEGIDPDSACRTSGFDVESYLTTQQQQGIITYGEYHFGRAETAIEREQAAQEAAAMLAGIDQDVLRDDYTKKLAKRYDIRANILMGMVSKHRLSEKKKAKKKGEKQVQKNEIFQLDTAPEVYQFFYEVLDNDGNLKELKIDKLRFVNLLKAFGYTRYAIDTESYRFVRVLDNIIFEVNRDDIIDHLEEFISTTYDFEGAGLEHTDASRLVRKLYDGLRSYFSEDLFKRIRSPKPLLFHKDTRTTSCFYFKNGWVEVTADGWSLKPYTEMAGSVWQKQMRDRDFVFFDCVGKDIASGKMEAGVFADFIWRIAGEELDRFMSLCSIIGYLLHDYYSYKLKAVNFTDSSLGDFSNGRSGKTLLGKLLAEMRAFSEINGKDFKADDERRYQTVDAGDQIIHINDVMNSGRYKFRLESVYNDITEGYPVSRKFKDPFRQQSKIIISSNSPLHVQGASSRDRVIEFEFSEFFGEKRSPADFYGHWFITEWDSREWTLFYNFCCYASMIFHQEGVISPKSINLEARKLKHETNEFFLEFMQDIFQAIEEKGKPWPDYVDARWPAMTTSVAMADVWISKNAIYERLKLLYPDLAQSKYFNMHRLNSWLIKYGQYKLGIEPQSSRSGAINYIKFSDTT